MNPVKTDKTRRENHAQLDNRITTVPGISANTNIHDSRPAPNFCLQNHHRHIGCDKPALNAQSGFLIADRLKYHVAGTRLRQPHLKWLDLRALAAPHNTTSAVAHARRNRFQRGIKTDKVSWLSWFSAYCSMRTLLQRFNKSYTIPSKV